MQLAGRHAKCGGPALQRDCREGEEFCSSLPVLFLLSDVESSSLDLLPLSATKALGCSRHWDCNCDTDPLPVMHSGWRYRKYALL